MIYMRAREKGRMFCYHVRLSDFPASLRLLYERLDVVTVHLEMRGVPRRHESLGVWLAKNGPEKLRAARGMKRARETAFADTWGSCVRGGIVVKDVRWFVEVFTDFGVLVDMEAVRFPYSLDCGYSRLYFRLVSKVERAYEKKLFYFQVVLGMSIPRLNTGQMSMAESSCLATAAGVCSSELSASSLQVSKILKNKKEKKSSTRKKFLSFLQILVSGSGWFQADFSIQPSKYREAWTSSLIM